jgi:hypothetical protein
VEGYDKGFVVHPQLQAVIDEFESAERRLRELVQRVPAERWPTRSDPARWSVAECVAHLNLTSRAYLPLLADALARARALPRAAPGTTYRRDAGGWLLWRIMGPPVRFRVKTTAPFVPSGADPPDALVSDFVRLQADQVAVVREADGLALTRVSIPSPFNSRIKYNLFTCFTILPRHQHRHLWQAEQVW